MNIDSVGPWFFLRNIATGEVVRDLQIWVVDGQRVLTPPIQAEDGRWLDHKVWIIVERTEEDYQQS